MRGFLLFIVIFCWLFSTTPPLMAKEAITPNEAAVAQPSYTQEEQIHFFIDNNRTDAEIYLEKLRALLASCCTDGMNYLTPSAQSSCPAGDLFYNPTEIGNIKRFQTKPGVHKPSYSARARAFFGEDNIGISQESVCIDKECSDTKTLYLAWARSRGKVGGADFQFGPQVCGVTVNHVKFQGFGLIDLKFASKGGEGGAVERSTSSKPRDPIIGRITIHGPANMSHYLMQWESSNAEIEQKSTPFIQSYEGIWSTETVFKPKSMPLQIKLTMKIDADHEWHWDDLQFAGNKPALSQLLLSRSGEGGGKVKAGDTIDIAYPSDRYVVGALFETSSQLQSGQEVPNWVALELGLNDIYLSVEDPEIALLHQAAGLEEGRFQITGRQPGATELRVNYAANLLLDHPQPMFQRYYLNVHRLMLSKIFNAGEPRLLLVGEGPNMDRLTVKWDGSDSKKFNYTDNSWQADSPAEGISKVEIFSGSTLLSTLEIARRVPEQVATIQLLPVETPEMTVLSELPMPATGVTFGEWAVSSGFCNRVSLNQLPRGAGANLDTEGVKTLLLEAQQACSNRTQSKQELVQLRDLTSRFNKEVKRLARGGNELIALSQDSINLGAAIAGLSWRYAERAYCRWRLMGDQGAKLAFTYTPISMTDLSSAGCLNQVSGLIQGFKPGMQVGVELVVDMEDFQPWSGGSNVVGTGAAMGPSQANVANILEALQPPAIAKQSAPAGGVP